MEFHDLLFAIGPPTLAIVLQKWGLPSEESLDSEAESTRATVGLNDEQKKRIRGSLLGAVAVANLATTYITILGGAAGLLYIAKAKPLFVYILLLVALVIFLFVANKLNRISYLDIVEMPLFAKFLRQRIDLINTVIYALNGILIVLAVCFYYNLLPTLASEKNDHAPKPPQEHGQASH